MIAKIVNARAIKDSIIRVDVEIYDLEGNIDKAKGFVPLSEFLMGEFQIAIDIEPFIKIDVMRDKTYINTQGIKDYISAEIKKLESLADVTSALKNMYWDVI